METNQLLNLTTAQLRRAAEIKEQIDQLNGQLGDILSGVGGEGKAAPQTQSRRGGRRQMSAEGRKRIADAARARWAKVRAAKGGSGSVSVSQPSGMGKRRTMSASARKKIAAAARARWAKVRAAKG